MLASINCISFTEPATDQQCLVQLLADVETLYSHKTRPAKQQMRHTSEQKDPHDELAKIPLAVPELPSQVCERPTVISAICDQLLSGESMTMRSRKVAAHGQGGCGETHTLLMTCSVNTISNLCTFYPHSRKDDGAWLTLQKESGSRYAY